MRSRGYIHNSSYYHHQIGSINLFHCCHVVILFRGCVPDVVVPVYAVGFIYIPGKLGFVYFTTAQSYDVCKQSSTWWPDGCIRECVSKIKSILSIIFHVMYGAVRIQFTHFSYDDCENTCTLSYYHHQIGSMTHLPLFRVRSWNNGMRCIAFRIIMESLYLTPTICTSI